MKKSLFFISLFFILSVYSQQREILLPKTYLLDIAHWTVDVDISNYCVTRASLLGTPSYFDCLFGTFNSISGNYAEFSPLKTGTRLETDRESPSFGIIENIDLFFSLQIPAVRYIYSVIPDSNNCIDNQFSEITVGSLENDNSTIVATSSGDTVFDTNDYWFITEQDGFAIPQFTLYFLGQDNELTLSRAETVDVDEYLWSIDTNLECVVEQRFMFFAYLATDLVSAQNAVSIFENPELTPELLSGLSIHDINLIQNFDIQYSSSNIPSRYSHSNLCAVSSEIRDRNSDLRRNQKHQFQRPWFC